jgi:hypothetical protein
MSAGDRRAGPDDPDVARQSSSARRRGRLVRRLSDSPGVDAARRGCDRAVDSSARSETWRTNRGASGRPAAEAIVPAIEPDDRYPGRRPRKTTDIAASRCRHCDSALPAVARRKGIVAVADAARSRPVETNRPVETVVTGQVKLDGGPSRLLSHRSQASTDAAVHRHAAPADGRHSPRSAAAASPGERSPRRRYLGRCRNSSI